MPGLKRTHVALAVAGLVFGAGAAVRAQGGPAKPHASAHPPGAAHPGPTAPAPTDGKYGRESKARLTEQVMDQMRALRMWKITEELKLDEATASRLFPVLARFDEQARTIGRERHEVYRELRSAVDAPHPDQAKISALVDRMEALQGRRAAMEQERAKATRKVLTPLQQAKLILVMPRIDEAFRRQIRDAVRGGERDGAPHSEGSRGRRRGFDDGAGFWP